MSGARRRLGPADLVLFYIVTGISLRWVATAAAAGPAALAVWLGAFALFYLPLALSVVELSSRLPGEGGLYLWTKHAFGDFAGFLAGWSYWASNLAYFPGVLYFGAEAALYAGPGPRAGLAESPGYFVAFSLAGLALATAMNAAGLRIGTWLHNAGALGTWLPIAALFGLALASGARAGSVTAFGASALAPRARLADLVFAAAIVYAFGGCESASLLGDEIRDARRNVPRALVAAGAIIALSYVAGTAAALVMLPPAELSSLGGFMQAIDAGARRAGAPWASPAVALLVAVGCLGGVGAWLAATARLPFVAGLDRYLPPAFGRTHPRTGAPVVALLTQAALGVLFVLFSQAGSSVKGAYDIIVSTGVITYMVPYLFLFAALVRVQREPAGPSAVRVPGGRPGAVALAALGVATTLAAIVLSLLPPEGEPRPALAVAKVVGLSALQLVAGAAVYARGRAKRRREAAAA
ncbi:MAG TPA: APC family permease [Polyangiaceae bacterium]|nr:APC family permease [Polyangiaceae bacterium]